MTIASRLLDDMLAIGVKAVADRNLLRLRPGSAVPPEMLVELRQHKAAIVALLAANQDRFAGRTALAKFCAARAAELIGIFNHADVQADRESIAAEALLPPPGTAERQQADARQAGMVAGLLAASRWNAAEGIAGRKPSAPTQDRWPRHSADLKD